MKWIATVVVVAWLFTAQRGLADASKSTQAEPDGLKKLSSFEAAVRIGFHLTSRTGEEDQPSGSGPAVEIEAGTRLAPWISAAIFGGFSTMLDPRVSTSYYAHDPVPFHDSRLRTFDLGARVTLHLAGVAAGIGLGAEYQNERFGSERFSTAHRMYEAHLGYSFPSVHGIAPQIFGVLLKAPDGSRYPIDLSSVRIFIGAQF